MGEPDEVVTLMNEWVNHTKFGMVAILGVTVTTTQLDSVLRVCIARATLTYTVIKCMSAARDYKNKKRDNDETLD